MQRRYPVVFALLLTIIVAGCSSSKESGPLPLQGTKWKLSLLKGARIESAQQSAYLTFTNQEGKLEGFGGCNILIGSYKTEGEYLGITDLNMTKAMCDASYNENVFVKLLIDTDRYSIAGNRLQLMSGGTVTAEFTGE